MRVGFVSGFLIGISFLVQWVLFDFVDFWIAMIIAGLPFLFLAGAIYDIEAHKIPQIVAEAEKEKELQSQESERVKCQCGYEYEGNKIPLNCPQCEKKLN